MSKYNRVSTVVQPVSAPISAPQSYGNKKRFTGYANLIYTLLCFVGGAVCAVAHHVFYTSQNGIAVSTATVNQAWTIRTGTGLAYTARLLFVLTVSEAYTQQQWLTTSSTSLKVRQIDALSSIGGNILNFFKTRIWVRFPILTLLAVTLWLLPIEAIFTPATIAVVSHRVQSRTSRSPAQLYYDPKVYGTLMDQFPYGYLQPASEVQRGAFGSATSSDILSFTSPWSNSSYDLQFMGPGLRCDQPNSSLISRVETVYNETRSPQNFYYFAAWVPQPRSEANFTQNTDIYHDRYSTDAAHLLVMPNTSIVPLAISGTPIYEPANPHYGSDDLLDCKLYNTSYEVSFNFTSPEPAIKVKSQRFLNAVSFASLANDIVADSAGSWRNDGGVIAQRACYASVMESFSRILVGYETWDYEFGRNLRASSYTLTAVDWTSRDSAKQGLQELFVNITMSLFSFSSLRMNETIAAQHPIEVTQDLSVNIYEYNARDLWIAYGVTLSAAFICMLCGFYALWRNGASYQNEFSTFLRTTYGRDDPSLRALLSQPDDGHDPLPRSIAEASIILGRTAVRDQQYEMHQDTGRAGVASPSWTPRFEATEQEDFHHGTVLNEQEWPLTQSQQPLTQRIPRRPVPSQVFDSQ